MLDERIVNDVYERTAGHAGCVGFCGKQIDEDLMLQKNELDYDEWVRYATERLNEEIARWATMKDLCKKFRSSNTEQNRQVAQARLRLCTIYFATKDKITPQSEQEYCLDSYLAAEGALVRVEGEGEPGFRMAAPLIRNLLIKRILPLLQHPHPRDEPPLRADTKLNFFSVLEKILPFFNRALMMDKRLQKKTCPGAPSPLAPQEDVYQTEILSVLRSWLPTYYRVLSQPLAIEQRGATGRPWHSDILITTLGQTILVEIVAHASQKSVFKHVTRASRDSKVLQATEAWVLNFTTRDPQHPRQPLNQSRV